MKSLLGLLILFIFSSYSLSAQVRGTILAGGYMPTGDYGSEDLSNAKAGSSQTGWGLQAMLDFIPDHTVSPNVMAFFSSNPMGGEGIRNTYPNANFSAQKPYVQAGFGVGLIIQTHREKKVNVGLTADGGFGSFSSPEFTVQDQYGPIVTTVKAKRNSVTTPWVMLGGVIRIPIGEEVTLNIEAEYKVANVDYGIISYEENGRTVNSPSGVEIPYRVIAAHAGFSYTF